MRDQITDTVEINIRGVCATVVHSKSVIHRRSQRARVARRLHVYFGIAYQQRFSWVRRPIPAESSLRLADQASSFQSYFPRRSARKYCESPNSSRIRTLIRTGLFVKTAIGMRANCSSVSATPGYAQRRIHFVILVIA